MRAITSFLSGFAVLDAVVVFPSHVSYICLHAAIHIEGFPELMNVSFEMLMV